MWATFGAFFLEGYSTSIINQKIFYFSVVLDNCNLLADKSRVVFSYLLQVGNVVTGLCVL